MRILVLGPFPPPFHGFSVATEKLAEKLETKAEVERYGLAAKTSSNFLNKFLNLICAKIAFWRVLLFTWKGGERVSLGCNGGAGLILTYIILLACRLSRVPTTLHHHSYAYINAKSRLMRTVVALSNKKITHIFLSEEMGRDFRAQYGDVASAVIPNAYMVEIVDQSTRASHPFRVGHMSNLTKEKGLFRFVDLVRNLNARGLDFEAVLAGPVNDPDAAKQVAGAVAEMDNLTHIGPVYGEDKARFLASLDLFVFPTDYGNEAQPIVLYEAMANGVPVVSINRGCIKAQVRGAIKVFDTVEQYDAEASGYIATIISGHSDEFEASRSAARARLVEDTEIALATIESLYAPPSP